MKAYQTLWYNAPLEQQKFIQIMILFAQKEQRFRGGGMISCDLERFLSVCTSQLFSNFNSIQSKFIFFFITDHEIDYFLLDSTEESIFIDI